MTDAEALDCLSQLIRPRIRANGSRDWRPVDVNRLTTVDSPYFDYQRAAEYCCCSVKTLQNAKCRGELRAVEGGAGVVFERPVLDKWMRTP